MPVLEADPSAHPAEHQMDAIAMRHHARDAANFVKSLAHEARLVILCRLSEGPATVTELEVLTDIRQSAVSQHLARLREEKLVTAQRDGRSIRYAIGDERARRVVKALYDSFCS